MYLLLISDKANFDTVGIENSQIFALIASKINYLIFLCVSVTAESFI